MQIVSEVNLNLPARWFRGSEWTDGTAEKYLRAEYRAASKAAQGKTFPKREKRLFMGFPKTLEELTANGYKHNGTSQCRACHADIEWWETPNGKKIPMDHGTATPHWSTCPNADDFRKPQAGRSTYEANHE